MNGSATNVKKQMTTKTSCHTFHHLEKNVFHYKLECGPMPNVLVALPNIGGALCSTPQSLDDDHYWSAMQ